jgi:uncharacterized peroxidase-related enzyme
MSFIQDATGESAEALYQADRERTGYVANYTRVFALRPEVYAAWKQLSAAIQAEMDARRYELATLAAARRLGSSYCMLAHGKIVAERFHDDETVRAIASDHRSAGLDAVDVAVMDLAEKVADDASTVTQQDIDRLRALGLSDTDVFDVVAAAAVRCFFSKALDGLGAPPDAAFRALDPLLREQLTIGRPIAEV